ncbi:MAG: hypothetical protein EXS31_12550 [Pedosphaera sp.]|nr:hypothetical protein [Pedosphaera sp.]
MRLLLLLIVVCHHASLSASERPADFAWASRFGGNSEDLGRSVCVDGRGGIFTSGHFSGSADFGLGTLIATGQAGFVMRLSDEGKTQWVVPIGGSVDDECRSVAADSDGNCVVTGNFRASVTLGTGAARLTLTSDGGTDILLLKLKADGSLLWAKKAGGIGNDYGYGVSVDGNGDIFVTGSYEGIGGFGGLSLPGEDKTQFFVAKYDSNGRALWVKDIAGGESGSGLAVRADDSGRVIVAGRYSVAQTKFAPHGITTAPPPRSDMFLSVYDSNGQNKWYQTAGGAGTDEAYDAATDLDGSVYVAGVFETSAKFSSKVTLSGESASPQIFLAKYDSAGKFLWAAKPSGQHGGEAHGVCTDDYGFVFVSGYFYGTARFGMTILSSTGNPAMFVAKYDPDGNVLWATQTPGSPIVVGLGFAMDEQSRMYVTGYFRSNATIGGALLLNLGGRDVFVTRLDPPPVILALNAKSINGAVVLRWPRTSASFQIESRTGFSAGTPWLALTNTASTYRDQWILTNQPSRDAEFYRLRRR